MGKYQEREIINFVVPLRSYPTRNRKYQKNSKKIQKNLKNTVMAPFQATIGWKRMKKEENKNYRSVSFLPDVYYKITKKLPKN